MATRCEEYQSLIRQRVEWARRIAKRDFRHLNVIKHKVEYSNNLITVDFKNKVEYSNNLITVDFKNKVVLNAKD